MLFPSLAILLTAFRAVVIPVQFQDREFVYGENDIKRMLTKAETYLDTQFRASVSFSFDLAATVTLSHDSSYYGWNGERGHDYLIHEALIQACTNSPDVDFSLYDNNSDGTVDGVILLAAGPSESDGTDPDELLVIRDSYLEADAAIMEEVALELPIYHLCREDCPGLCPRCGKRLADGDCGCNGKKDVDPRLAILQKLLDNPEEK